MLAEKSFANVRLQFRGSLHNQEELRPILEVRPLGLNGDDLPSLILAAWFRWGQNISEHLLGDFAIVIESLDSGKTFLTRSPMGIIPLYYAVCNKRAYCAFSPKALKQLYPATLTPDQDWMARYMLHLSMDNRKTAYKEMYKVAPAHSLQIDHLGNIKEWRYHQWNDDSPLSMQRDFRWVEDYRNVLEKAIRCRMDLNAPMGTENSGGLDSATVTAYLAHFLGKPRDQLHSFSFALFEQEPAFIFETSRAKNIVHNYVISGENADENDEVEIAQGLSILGYPLEHSAAMDHTPFYRECQLRGIKTLFSGFGGDEGVTNQGHLLKYELLDSGQYANLFEILPGGAFLRCLRLARLATVGRQSPEYRLSFFKAWNDRWPHQLLRQEVVERLNLHHIFMENARYDAPYRSINGFIMGRLLDAPYIATRHENSSLLAQYYGVQYQWPLWDVRLIQQYLSTPAIEKFGPRGIGRYLHRRAIEDVVPKRVAWNLSKSMGHYQMFEKSSLRRMALRYAKIAQSEIGNLHPALIELIDRDTLSKQIIRAQNGEDHGYTFVLPFSRSVKALTWLNRWLLG
jgi:asparagine synthase (glutamine-hydrolysing)